MAKIKVKDIVAQVLSDFLAEKHLELYNVEFVKESKDWFLRIYIDKIQCEEREEYVSTDDCEEVSRYLSEKLDEIDPIEQNYYLEVSSPGMDRVLIEEKDYSRFSGKQVDISLYKAIDGEKTYSGELVGIIDGNVVILNEKREEKKFLLEQVAKTKLTVVF